MAWSCLLCCGSLPATAPNLQSFQAGQRAQQTLQERGAPAAAALQRQMSERRGVGERCSSAPGGCTRTPVQRQAVQACGGSVGGGLVQVRSKAPHKPGHGGCVRCTQPPWPALHEASARQHACKRCKCISSLTSQAPLHRQPSWQDQPHQLKPAQPPAVGGQGGGQTAARHTGRAEGQVGEERCLAQQAAEDGVPGAADVPTAAAAGCAALQPELSQRLQDRQAGLKGCWPQLAAANMQVASGLPRRHERLEQRGQGLGGVQPCQGQHAGPAAMRVGGAIRTCAQLHTGYLSGTRGKQAVGRHQAHWPTASCVNT